MRITLYTNKKIKLLISNIIYDIQNYNFTISKYVENIDKTDEINEDKESIIRQSFLIDTTMKALNDFNDITLGNLSLNKNIENINILMNNIIDNCYSLFISKRVKIKLGEEISCNYNILIDKNKIVNCIFYVFMFIYNLIKSNSFIDLVYSFVNYEDERFLFFSEKSSLLNFSKDNILISISFDSNNIPEDIKRKLFKTPLISYNGRHFNNIFLYTAYYIINRHSGNIWFDNIGSKTRINIIFPIRK
ncbi:histidine kinase [Brachyspira pilosicoli]|uniref:Histidine kinase n=1 Tax=Brachyspira pilosicoli TaxID=52584 RepID=A0A5C8ERX2_BRAPL|nr:histidine kinase [Brachyspira pilosicoli]TXJ39834.1 histidine kinase [Brachyspira pilosicoli]